MAAIHSIQQRAVTRAAPIETASATSAHRPPRPTTASASTEAIELFGPRLGGPRSPALTSVSGTASDSLSSASADLVGLPTSVARLPTHDGRGLFRQPGETATLLGSSEGRSSAYSFVGASSELEFDDDDALDMDMGEGEEGTTLADDRGGRALTAQALASVDRAALTSSDDSDEGDAVDEDGGRDEEALSRTPQAASAGIGARRLAKRRMRLVRPDVVSVSDVEMADVEDTPQAPTRIAPVKRRHRKSGMSDKGSKRSTASSEPVRASVVRQPLRPVATVPAPSRPRASFFLGKVVGRIVDRETMDLVAQSDDNYLTPRHSVTPRRAPSPHGMTRLYGDTQYELGERSSYLDHVDSYDSGEETEVEHAPSLTLAPVHSAPPERAHALPRLEKARLPTSTGPARSLSLSSLPTLLDSLYASMPSGLLRQGSEQDESSDAAVRRSRSFAARRRSGDGGRTSSSSSSNDERDGYRAAVSYWRIVLRRFRDGLDAVM